MLRQELTITVRDLSDPDQYFDEDHKRVTREVVLWIDGDEVDSCPI